MRTPSKKLRVPSVPSCFRVTRPDGVTTYRNGPQWATTDCNGWIEIMTNYRLHTYLYQLYLPFVQAASAN